MKTYFKYFWQKSLNKNFDVFIILWDNSIYELSLWRCICWAFLIWRILCLELLKISNGIDFLSQSSTFKMQFAMFEFSMQKPLIEFHKNNERNINKAHKNGALMKLPLLMMLLETACLQSTFIILPDNYFCNSWQGI